MKILTSKTNCAFLIERIRYYLPKGRYYTLLFLLVLTSCQKKESEKDKKLFELLGPGETHIDFVNQLSYDADFNIFTYRNFYNGGGVAIGDVNNDGLPDIFLVGNM